MTDNAPNVLAIAKMLSASKGMNTVSFGCTSHILNLLMEHLIRKVPLISEITNNLKTIIGEIERINVNKRIFNKICQNRGKEMIVYP